MDNHISTSTSARFTEALRDYLAYLIECDNGKIKDPTYTVQSLTFFVQEYSQKYFAHEAENVCKMCGSCATNPKYSHYNECEHYKGE